MHDKIFWLLCFNIILGEGSLLGVINVSILKLTHFL